jgi:hypothetical protein
MAIYKIFPTQDATIYSAYPEKNTGLDEILETTLSPISLTGYAEASRFLIQFSSNEITDIINNKINNSTWDSYLRCFISNVEGLNLDTTLEIYPVSQSWDMGIGKYLYSPEVTTGVSWFYKDYFEGTYWFNTSSTFNLNTTGSGNPEASASSNIGGGTWYTNYTASQSFSYYENKDLSINVKDITRAWYSSSIPNNGFIVKQQTEFLSASVYNSSFKYFSRDTNTIYPPCLEFRWRDYTWNTGSSGLTILTTTPATIALNENPGVFYPESINRFRVNCRPEYPVRIYSTASYYTQNYYLPTASYYAIKDLDTNEVIFDFDTQYTQLSADENGSYFDLYMNGLEPERYYSILIKTTINNNTMVFDNDYYFKIINE